MTIRSLKTAAAVALGALALAGTQAGSAQAATVGGVSSGAVASFSTCQGGVYGRAFTLSSLGADGVWARAWVYDFAAARWGISAWVAADGITAWAVPAANPYRYAYMQFARYVGGWRYAAEYFDISAELDNGFCR